MMTHYKRPRNWPSFLLICSCFLPLSTWATDLTYVTPETKARLEKDFESAKSTFTATLDAKWSCEMVGVRTGLQHQIDVPLYAFNSLTNSGASPIKSFQMNSEKTELEGVSGKIRDQVRKISDKEIISRMSLVNNNQTLAYARCTKT